MKKLIADMSFKGEYRMRLRGIPFFFIGKLTVENDKTGHHADARALFIGPIMIGTMGGRRNEKGRETRGEWKKVR